MNKLLNLSKSSPLPMPKLSAMFGGEFLFTLEFREDKTKNRLFSINQELIPDEWVVLRIQELDFKRKRVGEESYLSTKIEEKQEREDFLISFLEETIQDGKYCSLRIIEVPRGAYGPQCLNPFLIVDFP